ncbi:hypothetical protein FE257_005224 [Aspergillus nanangensis]|uniref:DUF167 domain protein n=1 Tax=Aspergillus nanangensis TaxID=2582783 RepID=A0AAD4GVM0_ASPNN|nr:hypothetical protein FE257_005224 [Aspergillus nanangensis]
MSTPPYLPLFRLIQVATTKSRNSSSSGGSILPHRYHLQITCHVKPNTSGYRHGITAVDAEKVNVCVAAVPRNGEANAAVSRVIAQVLHIPKSNVDVIRGMKSRDKTLCVSGVDIMSGKEEEFLQSIHGKLTAAAGQK